MSVSTQAFEAAMFKRVADGFIFRAPSLWPFARARYFIASESQTSEIADRVAGSGRWRLLLAFLSWILVYSTAVVGWTYMSGKSEPTLGDVLAMLLMAVGSLLVCLQIWYALTLRPVIRGLSESAERISYQERREALRRALSLRSWLLAGAMWTVACAINVHALFLKSHGFRHIGSMGDSLPQLGFTVLSGLLAVRFLYLEVRNANARPKETIRSDVSIDGLVQRLERVESDNARLRRSLVGLVAMGGILAIGATLVSGLTSRIVEADAVMLRNSEGSVAGLLGVAKNGMPSLALYDTNQKIRMLLGLGTGGAPSVGLYGPDAQLQKSFAITEEHRTTAQLDMLMSRFQSPPPRAAVESYLAAPGAKAWVNSAATNSRTTSTGAPSVEVAKARALQQCGKLTNASDCTVVIVNNDWVGGSPPISGGSR